ncbi:trafficking protein particle complex subunit 9 isoform X1 [Hydra vulgaris]|uniref:trafficking protein particle complex subunit 9 isoform X1 n=1 Tax=Hydra vulgaris TaxID=6087 RepID=UPI001F5E9AFD|nr:trafficking protein particle complex subunit 9-like [Hydra vulgaris]
MMHYDFRPNLLDHGRILILVRPFFNTSDQDFSFILQKLSNISHAEIQGTNRRILLKFTKGYSQDALEWGCLQTHRRPFGFIGVAKLSVDTSHHGKDYEIIVHRFSNLISQYSSHLYDSRCIIIGPEEPTIIIGNKNILYLSMDNEKDNSEFLHFVSTFVSSLHVILESKRIDKINESPERMLMPLTANDKDQNGSDSDTRIVKRKCIGRNKKILADLCFLAGYYQDSLLYYQQSVDLLQNANDFLWVGSALEGLCAVSSTIGIGSDIKKLNQQELVIDNSNINVNGDCITFSKVLSCIHLSDDEIIIKYNECLRHYRRYVTGPIEIEAHFKFIRFLIKLKKKLEISQTVQSLLNLPITFNDAEKIEITSVLASIYEQIGLMRKSAFYRHRAALQYKNTNSSKNSFSQALILLKKICPAYQIDIEHSCDSRDIQKGWPAIQLKVLMDMLSLSRSLGNKLDSVKLICHILEEHIKDIDLDIQRDLIDWLEEYSDGKEPLHNEIDSELEIKLIKPLPIIKDFHPKKLPYHLEPFKSNNIKRTDNPFIFSSLSTKKPKDKKDVVWVCGDVSEVVMFVENPLPAEIKVNNMTLITDGIPFEAHPATLALPAESGFIPFMLLGTPKEAGTLVIKGYKVAVLGITNTIYLPTQIIVEVTPPMPALRLSSTFPRAPSASMLDPEDKNYRTLFNSVNVYQGHSCNGKLTLENTGKVAITKLSFEEKNEDCQILFNEEQVLSQLPLLPHQSLILDVELMPAKSWKFCNNKDKIETLLSITYSCEEAVSMGYTRKIMWNTIIKVMPSLVLYDFAVNEIERHPTCSLICFNAINMTSITMDLECNSKIQNAEFDIPKCCQKSIVQVLEPKKSISIQIHHPRINLPPSEFIMETIECVYQKFVAESIWLNWRLSGTNYDGVTYLQGFKVTSDIVNKLKPTPINMVININDKLLHEEDVVCSTVGELVKMTIDVKNSHGNEVGNLVLQIKTYQGCQRTPEYMKKLYVPFGSLSKSIKKIAVGENFIHQCGFLFLYKGDYMVDVLCSVSKLFGMPTMNDHRLNIEQLNVRPSLSSNLMNTKLKSKEADVWAQTFCIKVQ